MVVGGNITEYGGGFFFLPFFDGTTPIGGRHNSNA